MKNFIAYIAFGLAGMATSVSILTYGLYVEWWSRWEVSELVIASAGIAVCIFLLFTLLYCWLEEIEINRNNREEIMYELDMLREYKERDDAGYFEEDK